MAVRPSDIGRSIPGRVVSYVQQHPKTNWIIAGIGDLAVGVPEALKAAGLEDKVQLISIAGSKVNFDYIRNKQVQVADVHYPNEFHTWQALDHLARLMVGDDPPTPQWQSQIVDSEVLAQPGNESGPPGVVDFKEKFKRLWSAD